MPKQVTAPHNFVPLSKHVCKAEDLHTSFDGLPAQDIPIVGGLTGEVSISLEARTPFLISGAQENSKSFITDPETGHPLIPGSSLRGMIRNVMEIATFGKFMFVDDRTHGVRDLAGTARLDYGDRITEKRKGGFAPKSRAGWLQRKGGELVLTRCEYGRIEHHHLGDLAPGFGQSVRNLGNPRRVPDQDKRQAQQVEELFLRHKGELNAKLYVQNEETAHQHSGRTVLTYHKVTPNQVADATLHDGQLVFTGLPGPKKHMEFFFFNPANEMPVPDKTWQKFIAVHEEQEKENKTWIWRRHQLDRGEKIPVFWLPGKEGIAHVGLAMMFKIAADNSTHDLIRNTSEDHLDPEIVDLPTRLFGRMRKDRGFKTRLSFGYAFLERGEPKPFSREVVGAAPKPGFLPSAIRQVDLENERTLRKVETGRNPQPAQYRSYMDWNDEAGNLIARSELRGWKRYPARGNGAHEPPSIPPSVGEGARTRLHAIYDKDGLCFTGKLRFHNIHPIELGALLWCLDFGAEAGLVHSLGMGKAYGWGQIILKVGDISASPNFEEIDAEQCRREFTDAMETWASQRGIAGGWAKSEQILRLKAMADPKLGSKRQVDYLKQMVLNPDEGPRGRNDFVDAKKAGSVLPEYRHPDEPVFAATVLSSTDVKGGRKSGGQGGGGNKRTGGRSNNRPQNPQSASTGPFTAGERVTWLEKAITVSVHSNEKNGLVEIDADGTIEEVRASELRR